MKNSKLFRLSFKIIIVILFMICIFPQKETNVLKAETNITYDNIEDSVTYLRDEMVNRNTNVSFTVEGTHLTESEIINLYNLSIQHTGVAYEGNYIDEEMHFRFLLHQIYIMSYDVPIIRTLKLLDVN